MVLSIMTILPDYRQFNRNFKLDLLEYYNNLFRASSKDILEGNHFIDYQINSSSDNRFGLTLIIKPNAQIKKNIQFFFNELKTIDSSQYYYPLSDIHITVISIISCYDGFNLTNISLPQYIEIIKTSIADIKNMVIDFKGVTASDSAIMIQGFPMNDSLNKLRSNLRQNFKSSGLEQSIDKRYSIFTAHSTVVRFSEKIKNSVKFVETLEKCRQYNFGRFEVENFELVYNDWYLREKFIQQLKSFSIK